jgi:RNA polymerase sigma factor (TIGR02999 family)
MVAQGDTASAPERSASSDILIGQLYAELREIAQRQYRWAGSPMTLQPTALVSEAYLKLARRVGWHSREHFLGCAATAMRHVLIDRARARLAAKRSGQTGTLDDGHVLLATGPQDDAQVLLLGEALEALQQLDPQLARIVDCKVFIGLTEAEIAGALGLSDRTVRRQWQRAKAALHLAMTLDEGDDGPASS